MSHRPSNKCNCTGKVNLAIGCGVIDHNVIQQKGKVRCGVECNPMELVRFIGRDFVAMNEMCERAGFSEREIFERTKQTFQYFNLPFDATCPE